MTVIDDYLDALPEAQRATLIALRDALRELLPGAEERISYRMPCFAVRGKAVAGFAGFNAHCSYFPHSGSVLARAGALPPWAEATAGTLRFPLGRRLPKSLLKRLIRIRLDEISAVTDGKRIDFFDDGTVKAEGSMRDGLLHGSWRWYRRDGSLLRTGRFERGEAVGTWQSWDRDGKPVGAGRSGAADGSGRAATAGVKRAGAGDGPVLLAGGNPQVAKGDGDGPVRAYLSALSGWKRDTVAGLDELIVRTVPDVRKAVRWNSPFYGTAEGGWFLGVHCLTRYVKVTFFAGTSLEPMPPVSSKTEGTRCLHLHEGDPFDEAQLAAWIRRAATLPGWRGF